MIKLSTHTHFHGHILVCTLDIDNPFCSRSKGGGGSKKEGRSKIKEGAPPSYVALATTLSRGVV